MSDDISSQGKSDETSDLNRSNSDNDSPNATKCEVDQNLLHSLTKSGINEHLAKKALLATKNESTSAAVQWIAELGAEEMEGLIERCSSEENSDWEDCDEEDENVLYKMVVVVNSDLKMAAGKVAAQVSHGVLGLYRILKRDIEQFGHSLREWETNGEKIVVVGGRDASSLRRMVGLCRPLDVAAHLVVDAGRTQVEDGATTALALFGQEEAVDQLCGHLKLF